MDLFDFFKKKLTAAEVIADLERLGYFVYADPADRDQLKLEIGKGLAEDHYLPFVAADRPTYKPLDPRHYMLDNETLFEQGGIRESLKEMASLFEKMKVRMEISEHIEAYEGNGLNHEITLNGKKYVIFHQWEGYGWGEAAQRFADMINDQLGLQGSKERLYLIYGSNDGRAIYLTAEQYAVIKPLIEDVRESPLPTAKWCKAMGVVWYDVVDRS